MFTPLLLDVMRKHSKSFLVYVLFGIIIIVFIISFGPGSECTPKGETLAATVNGERVPITEFENIYNHDPRYRFRDRKQDTAQMRQAAMDALVEREILAQEAERLGIHISDKELGRRIRDIGWLHKDGKFDMDYYKRWVVGVMNSSIPAFEERLRKDFLGGELRALVFRSVRISNDEVREAWRRQEDKANLEYVEFDPAAARRKIKVTPEEVKAWKEKHRKELEEHWKSKRFLYFARKQYQVRQIALRLPKGAGPAVRKPIKDKLEKLRAQLQQGKDFAALARAQSQDEASKAKGGSLGLLERKEMPSPEFRKVATETAVGKVSRVFCDTKFCRVIKVEKTRERELKELEDEIAAQLLKEDRARRAERAQAEAALAKLRANPKVKLESLAPRVKKKPQTEAEKKAAAKKRAQRRKLREQLRKALAKIPGAKLPNLKDDDEPQGPYGKTGAFSRARNFLVPKIGISKDLMRAAFQASKKGAVLPKVFEVGKKLYVVRVLARIKPTKADAADLQQTRQRLLTLKRVRVLESWLDGLRKRAKVSVNSRVLRPPEARRKEKEEPKAPRPKKKS